MSATRVDPVEAEFARPRHLRLHGHEVAYRQAGDDGPVLLLIHGITGNAGTWDRVVGDLARDFRVVAPDLLGHGASAKPRGDYSLGAYASGLRDLLIALGHDSATIVGHSLGGGVAMQLAYQHPELCERLVLVCSGGLGRAVHPILRSAALPGSEWVLPVLASERVVGAASRVGRLLGGIRLRPDTDVQEMALGMATLGDLEARRAFLHTVGGIIDPGGQRVDATDRLYLAKGVPTLIMWGERDSIIPVRHGRRAHEQIEGSRLEVFPQAGHYPHRDEPLRFVRVLRDFLASTQPADLGNRDLRALLRGEGG